MPVSWAKRRKNHKIKPYLKVKSSGVIDDTFNNFLAFSHPIHKSEELFIKAISINALFHSLLRRTQILVLAVKIKVPTSSFKRVE